MFLAPCNIKHKDYQGVVILMKFPQKEKVRSFLLTCRIFSVLMDILEALEEVLDIHRAQLTECSILTHEEIELPIVKVIPSIVRATVKDEVLASLKCKLHGK